MRIFARLLYVCLCCNAAAWSATSWEKLHAEGRQAFEKNDFKQGEKLFRESWPLAENNVRRGITANDIAYTLHNQGREQEARTWFETAIVIWEHQSGSHNAAAHSANGLADVLRGLGDYDAAARVHRKTLGYPGLVAETRSEILNAYADLLREEGEFQQSLELFEESIALKGISQRRSMDALLGIGDLARHYGDYQRSVDSLRQASEMAEIGQNPLPQAVAIRGMAQTYMEKGLLARAEPLLRRSLNLLETSNAAPQQVAMTMACTGDLYWMEGKLALAEDAWNKTIELEKSSFGENHPQVAMILQQLSELYAAEKRMDLADTYAQRAYSIMKSVLGESSPAAASALASMATVEAQGNRFADSAAHFQQSLAILDKTNLGHDSATAVVMMRYATVLKAMHRGKDARAMLTQAKALRQAAMGN